MSKYGQDVGDDEEPEVRGDGEGESISLKADDSQKGWRYARGGKVSESEAGTKAREGDEWKSYSE